MISRSWHRESFQFCVFQAGEERSKRRYRGMTRLKIIPDGLLYLESWRIE
jgi:hypothetical protein